MRKSGVKEERVRESRVKEEIVRAAGSRRRV